MFYSLLIAALNRLLEQEVWARDALLEHVGKTALLIIGPISFHIKVDETGGLLADASDIPPTVCIEVPSEAVPYLFDGVDAFSRNARVSGDAHFAETIARLLRHLRPDLGGSLSPLLGNIVASRLEQGLSTAFNMAQQSMKNLGANIFEYVTEEKALVVKRSELEVWDVELARLRDDLARLEKRVARVNS